jgi:hypothetical protein
MTPQERKAVGAMVRQASDLYAAAAGNTPVWSKRDHMREFIGQFVDEHMALIGDPAVLAEWIIEANRGHGERIASESDH